jgi:hypothetical protein
MNKYEELKSLYKSQSEVPVDIGSKQIISKSRFLRRKLLATQLVLGTTVLVLLYFFFYISAYRVPAVAIALSVMIGVLVLRILLEFFSMMWLKRLEFTSKYSLFNIKLKKYHFFRRIIQFIATPLLFFIYIGGFIALLPFFKENLSAGFYQYIWISGIVIFLVLGLIIGNDIRKELKLLKILAR